MIVPDTPTVVAPPPTTVVASPTSVSTTRPLPPGNSFSQISATGGGILLDGNLQQTSLTPPQSCEEESAPVNGQTLQWGPVATAGCGDPAIWGESVTTVTTYSPHASNASIAIATRDPETAVVTDGPVVMTYGNYSDTRPLTTDGGGWLWIYDVDTTRGPEVLQVSASTGRVDDTVAMPEIYRPILAATDDGLWIGTSNEGIGSSGPGGGPPDALYYVSAGSDAPIAVIVEKTLPVCWLVAGDDSVWAGLATVMSTGCLQQAIWHFTGSGLQPVSETPLSGDVIPADGLGQSSVVDNPSGGLWTASFDASDDTVEVIGIDPDRGTETVVATVPVVSGPDRWPNFSSPLGQVGIEAVVVGGSLYLLEPALPTLGFDGAIVRVTPTG